MSEQLIATSPLELSTQPATEHVSTPSFLGVVVVAIAIAALGMYATFAVDAGDRVSRGIAAAIAIVWAIAAIVTARTRSEPLCLWCALVGVSIVVALLGIARYDETLSASARLLRGYGIASIPLVVAALIVALPDGRVPDRVRKVTLGLLVVLGVVFGVILAGRHGGLQRTPIIIESVVFAFVSIGAFLDRYRRASAVERTRMQWAGWGFVVSMSITAGVWLLRGLLGWPSIAGEISVASTAIVPIAIAIGAVDRRGLRIDRLLAGTIEAGGLMIMVGTVYVVVVLGFGDAPHQAERRVLGLSMIAAVIAALLYAPTRARLVEFANRRVYGERQAPDEPLQTFGARMSRAIPLDELLLQLAESLKKSMQLSSAEVWTGSDGVLECAASVPFREPERVRLRPDEVSVISRAHVQGNAWLQVWLPELLNAHPGRVLRVAPMVHSGELLGLVVCERAPDASPFNDEEERVMSELARQVALALHNTRLDNALQASLDELRVANEQLRASRSRIVAAADQSRRRIERDLHDGAQQRLVALAVKLGLARQLLDKDPEQVGKLLEDLRGETQSTLTELRELAHGIYPPLLMDRGLGEALVAAANRSLLPTEVHADVGRYASDVEAAVYFCCLEAMQNAGKHAGEGATIKLSVFETDGDLCFDVADSGAGFDTKGAAIMGHGFVNMEDRLGAIGGTLTVESAPGAGTHVRGRIPAAEAQRVESPTPAT
jgi:signal transduction histidine kinase